MNWSDHSGGSVRERDWLGEEGVIKQRQRGGHGVVSVKSNEGSDPMEGCQHEENSLRTTGIGEW